MMAIPDIELWFAVQRFVFHEAQLLDERRLREWLELFTPEAEYWVPYTWEQRSPRDHVSLYWETVPLLRMRIERLEHEATASQLPHSRVNHHLTNLTVEGDPTVALTAQAYLLYVEYRRDEQRTFSGRCTWQLQPHEGSFRIAHKRVDLLNADQDSGHLRFSIPF